jgi:hypothetical protein
MDVNSKIRTSRINQIAENDASPSRIKQELESPTAAITWQYSPKLILGKSIR